MENPKEVLICRCQEVSEKELRQAIDDGCRTLKGIKNRTEAMMGLCQGKTCRRLIEKMLAEANAEPQTPSLRPPVRPLSLEVLADAGTEILRQAAKENETPGKEGEK